MPVDFRLGLTHIRRVGMLQGLSLKLEKRSFDLITMPESDEWFQGVIKLQDARLIVNVFSSPYSGKSKAHFCHLRVVRRDGYVGA
ncbi:conserved hypothetical protein [Roseovarius sp. EC-HK134]|uniref:hypothetical protein n=1 Tax=unclassified Roseovarius TaxID=2614913 RepID=UPI00125C0AAB|nr:MULTISPECIES: hypothetical protein [unclassified Roseovarius]VVT13909.1 conserved hypothetical protein [Roseovarius sp. EC-SD190]VVT14803.1 conserved hypothetical protein [Roseovarius sp. EC-HK134]